MMRKKLNLFLIILLTYFIYACNSGSGGNHTNPQQITAIQNFADNFVAQYKSESGLSAVSITAQCNGMNYGQPITVFAGTVGHGAQNQAPIQPYNLWQIGSNSKAFTSIVLIKLASNPSNNFSLDDHIQKWLNPSIYPELQNLLRYNPTIRQMMNMTSGIPDDASTNQAFSYWINHPYQYESPVFWVSNFANSESAVGAGTQWNYADTNYNLFDLVVRQVTGSSLKDEINALIILPLGLKNTYYIANLPTEDALGGSLVHTYFQYENFGILDGYNWSLSNDAGAGSMLSTTEDMNTFYMALFTTNKILNKSQFAQMNSLVDIATGDSISSPTGSKIGQGYGLGIFEWDYGKYINYVASQTGNNPLKQYSNLESDINTYSELYLYPGQTLMTFTQIYNVKNGISLMVGYNSPFGPGAAVLVNPILNYMDPICH